MSDPDAIPSPPSPPADDLDNPMTGTENRNPPGMSLWADPASGERLDHCPYHCTEQGAAGQRCLIHKAKPQICSGYPTRLHNHKCVGGREFHGR